MSFFYYFGYNWDCEFTVETELLKEFLCKKHEQLGTLKVLEFFCNIPKFIFKKFICTTIFIFIFLFYKDFMCKVFWYLIFLFPLTKIWWKTQQDIFCKTCAFSSTSLYHERHKRAKWPIFFVSSKFMVTLYLEMRQWCHKLMFQLKTEFDFYHQLLQRSFLKQSIKSFLPQGYTTTYNDQNNQSNVTMIISFFMNYYWHIGISSDIFFVHTFHTWLFVHPCEIRVVNKYH